MNICNCVYWVVSNKQAENAGFRVRTKPIADALTQSGIKVNIITQSEIITELKEIIEANNIVVLTKPSDSLAYLYMKYFTDRGISVIVDIFDNYYGWSPTLFQRKLHLQMLRIISSATEIVVSTAFLKEDLEKIYRRTVHVVNDTSNALLIELEENTLMKWDSPDYYECLWFGIPNNPYFTSGLDDVLSWTTVLADLQIKIFPKKIRFNLCTTQVAQVELVLEHLRRHDIEATFTPWSLSECNRALTNSQIVLIPTSLSSFSQSKTHNRCSDALKYRCAVLTNPQSPYQDIPGAIFTDVAQLAKTLKSGATEILTLIDLSLHYISTQFNSSHSRIAFQSVLEAAAKAPVTLKKANTKILLVSSCNIETIKTSRLLGYINAGFSNMDMEINFDVFYHGIKVGDGYMHFSFSNRGFEEITKNLRANLDTEWIETGTLSICKISNATLRFENKMRTCDIEASNLIETANEVEKIRPLLKHNPSQIVNWHDINIALLIEFFLLLGFSDIDFASDKDGGWTPYIKRIAPEVGDFERSLKQHWLTHNSTISRPTLDSETSKWG